MLSNPSMLVVDDHQIVSSGIQLILHANKMKLDLTSCLNGEDCLEILKHQNFDVIIMDVNIPDTDTLLLLELILKLNSKQKILIYTMSSDDEYRIKFMNKGAAGFISKNASNDQFIEAFRAILKNKGNKIINSFDNDRADIEKVAMKQEEKELGLDKKISSQFFVKVGDLFKQINLQDVDYFKVDGKYINIYCGDGRYSMRSSLNNLENRIDKGFIRVHGAILVNEKKIASINSKNQTINLTNGNEIRFSRSFRKTLLKNITVA